MSLRSATHNTAPPRPPLLRSLAFVSVAFLVLLPAPIARAQQDAPEQVIRFGFSKSMFREMNESDTRAAIRSYATLLTADYSLKVDESPGLFADPAEMATALANGTVDVLSMSAEEYLGLPPNLARDELVCASQRGSATEQCVLLVRAESPIRELSDLRGSKLIVVDGLRTSLGVVWLEVILGERGLGTPAQFFSTISQAGKPSRAILPVFFNQSDACLVTRKQFDVLGELNPQILKQLRILDSSPIYLPHATVMRRSLSDNTAKKIIEMTLSTERTVVGQQILTIFQTDHIFQIVPADYDSARQLLAARSRLRASRTAGGSQPAIHSSEASQ